MGPLKQLSGKNAKGIKRADKLKNNLEVVKEWPEVCIDVAMSLKQHFHCM